MTTQIELAKIKEYYDKYFTVERCSTIHAEYKQYTEFLRKESEQEFQQKAWVQTGSEPILTTTATTHAVNTASNLTCSSGVFTPF